MIGSDPGVTEDDIPVTDFDDVIVPDTLTDPPVALDMPVMDLDSVTVPDTSTVPEATAVPVTECAEVTVPDTSVGPPVALDVPVTPRRTPAVPDTSTVVGLDATAVPVTECADVTVPEADTGVGPLDGGNCHSTPPISGYVPGDHAHVNGPTDAVEVAFASASSI